MLGFLFVLGLVLCVATGVWNIGFVGVDDYRWVASVLIPYGSHSTQDLILFSGVRSPWPLLYLRQVLHFFHWLGVQDPVWQYRLLLGACGAFAYSGIALFGIGSLHGENQNGRRATAFFLLITGFYFLSPYFLSRASVEALCTPWFFMSACFAVHYWRYTQAMSLLLSLVTLAVACLLRPQCGVAFIVLAVLPFFKGRGHVIGFCLTSLILFGLAGVADVWLKGRFHATLYDYLIDNIRHSSSYGTGSFFMPFALMFALTLPPFLWSLPILRRMTTFLKGDMPLIAYFAVFLLVHALIPRKTERFFIPLLPFLFLGMARVLNLIWVDHARRWRAWMFLGFNGVVVFFFSFCIPQHNYIGLALWVRGQHGLKHLNLMTPCDALYPEVFSPGVSFRMRLFSQREMTSKRCDTLWVGRRDLLPETLPPSWRKVASFEPYFIDRLLLKLNYKKNQRRQSLDAFSNCPQKVPVVF